MIGRFANGGSEWAPSGSSERVNVHDFKDPELGEYAKAVPCGVYDLANNEGWVNVGDNADTSKFAVQSIRRWWCHLAQGRAQIISVTLSERWGRLFISVNYAVRATFE